MSVKCFDAGRTYPSHSWGPDARCGVCNTTGAQYRHAEALATWEARKRELEGEAYLACEGSAIHIDWPKLRKAIRAHESAKPGAS